MSGIIGIVGGVGPYAGLDLQQKILANTVARCDQEYLPVTTISAPAAIVDRTAFLQGRMTENPAGALAAQAAQLAQMGATAVGIPCNTAHAPRIFDPLRTTVKKLAPHIRLLHMIEEVGAFLAARLPNAGSVGVLSTTGTYEAGFYPQILGRMGFTAVLPSRSQQESIVHPAIYDPAYGIKAHGRAAPRVREELEQVIGTLREAGAAAIILGCTELPLAFPEKGLDGVLLIDPTEILARALIRCVAPEKLRPYQET